MGRCSVQHGWLPGPGASAGVRRLRRCFGPSPCVRAWATGFQRGLGTPGLQGRGLHEPLLDARRPPPAAGAEGGALSCAALLVARARAALLLWKLGQRRRRESGADAFMCGGRRTRLRGAGLVRQRVVGLVGVLACLPCWTATSGAVRLSPRALCLTEKLLGLRHWPAVRWQSQDGGFCASAMLLSLCTAHALLLGWGCGQALERSAGPKHGCCGLLSVGIMHFARVSWDGLGRCERGVHAHAEQVEPEGSVPVARCSRFTSDQLLHLPPRPLLFFLA